MTERADPSRAGFRAGRLVGVVTAVLVVVSLLRVQESFVGRLESIARFTGFGLDGPISVYFYLYVAGAALGRYALSYVLGALIGVVYDWLDRPSVVVLAGLTLLVGVADGVVAVVDTRDTLVGVAYVLAWLLYIPLFLRYVDDEASYTDGPVRVDEG
jgi:hypothetical protein